MRYQWGFGSPTPNVTIFLILIIASYLVFAVIGSTSVGSFLYSALILDPRLVIHKFQIWRLITYAFMHDPSSPMHVIFNALILYMIGTPLEERWGEKRFFIFVLVAIISGGILVCLSYFLGISRAMVLGFSAGTIALVIAWGLIFSRQNIYIFGIIPLTGKQLVYITIGLEVLYAVSRNSISSAAHFGGILAAFIMTYGLYKPARLKQLWHQIKHKSLGKK